MSEPEIVDGAFTGGCQCGAVRYRTTMRPANVHYCHCRMCQRAVGNVFATFGSVRWDRLAWVKGAPAIYESSSVAERGFCRDCGTPLFFRYKASPNIGLTLGSFDDPGAIPPEHHYGIESHVPWLVIADELPREPTNMDAPYIQGIVPHQDPAGASRGRSS